MTQSDPNDDVRKLDVREIDGEPFGDIMSALAELPTEQRLLLVNSFEPEPLYDVLETRGFTYEATQAGPEEWQIVIEHA